MVNPAYQLVFICKNPSRWYGIESDFVLELIATSSIACISICDNIQLTELPSSSGLQLLELTRCPSLKQIGDCPNLKTLRLSDCSSLEGIGEFERLQNLVVGFAVSNPAPPLEQFLSQFPLEQIQKLSLGYVPDAFFTLSARLTDLKYLRLFQRNPMTMPFPGELFPSLTELQTIDFSSVRLTGMTHLRNLHIINTPSNQIKGKEEICTQLRCFSYSCYGDPVDDSFFWVLKNATDLSLTSVESDFLESLSEKVTSLDLYMQGREVTIPNRFFEELRLHNCVPSSSFLFSNVQILVLDDCYEITDIIPFKDIPYLELMQLPEVTDFSALGNQRYLMIWECPGLSDEAVSGFGNVFHLHIFNCENLTEVKNLQGKNKFLTLDSCFGLQSVELSNQDYIHVNIIQCGLDNFKIYGTVYSLEMAITKRWTKATIPRKYQYLNGKEIEV
jgi:hypothetical protein